MHARSEPTGMSSNPRQIPVAAVYIRGCEKNVRMFRSGVFPSLHHSKEGWPNDQIKCAKPPLTRGRGGFAIENKRKTAPAASASVASRHFINDAATPPCGNARRGMSRSHTFRHFIHSFYDCPHFVDSMKDARSYDRR